MADDPVWITTSEAGVLRVWHSDPGGGWGYAGPRQVPAPVLARYQAADAEYWAAAKAVGAYFPEDD